MGFQGMNIKILTISEQGGFTFGGYCIYVEIHGKEGS